MKVSNEWLREAAQNRDARGYEKDAAAFRELLAAREQREGEVVVSPNSSVIVKVKNERGDTINYAVHGVPGHIVTIRKRGGE